MTKQLLFISLSVLLTLATVGLALAGHAQIGTAVRAHVDPSECRYARSDGRRGFTDREVQDTIRCDVRRWPVPGGAATALRIANCESGYETKTSGSYLGVYQFAPSTWSSNRSRFRALGRRWDLSWSALKGRANVTVAIKVASTTGWGPWSCY
jgi:hypothetical protein